MVLTSGCFDGVHAGHVAYLEAAKSLCDPDELLVCAIAPDAYIAQVKGRTPRWTQVDRVRAVYGLQSVDAALAQREGSIAAIIREYRPRCFIKGIDWEGRLPEDVRAACEEVGTHICYVETPGRHVSETPSDDEAALARFEALVLSQQPASVPWQPVTDYSFEARKAIEGPHPELIKEVFQPRYVCDVGCGPGHLAGMLRDGTISVDGLDKATGEDITDAETLPIVLYDGDDPYDLVICREVLEHLTVREIRLAVTNLCALSSQYVYVTTRFAKAPRHLLDVDTSDDLDPTHITMMSKEFLRALFVLEGFKRRADLEERLDWKRVGRVLVYERI